MDHYHYSYCLGQASLYPLKLVQSSELVTQFSLWGNGSTGKCWMDMLSSMLCAFVFFTADRDTPTI